MSNTVPLLVLNSGSSSIKYCVYDMARETLQLSGEVNRIGESSATCVQRRHADNGKVEKTVEQLPMADYKTGLEHILSFAAGVNTPSNHLPLTAIGHRVVHGGTALHSPTLIDETVLDTIRRMTPLAPLHNPANLAGIHAMRELCPRLPQVAVFDTAFFRHLPAHASRYALPEKLMQQQVRRYGFHGISHDSVSQAAAALLQRPLQDLRMITLHLGNGASAAAIRDGVCIDTSMGMTPLEGLIMGTRCGDLDPSVHFYLARSLGMTLEEMETLFNHDSGMKGLCGASDMREVHRLNKEGNEQAHLALKMYCYRICKYIGAYHAILGGLDALVFTGGIGENDIQVRQLVCAQLTALGIDIDSELNVKHNASAACINSSGSTVKVLVIPTNEELEIARRTLAVIRQKQPA